MKDLLAKFVAAFTRGLDGELAAMRDVADSFEIPLARGDELGALRYTFELAPTDRLVAGAGCSLRALRGEQRVVIERFERTRITLVASQAIDVTTTPIALVVAPWFLYDRLRQALEGLDVERHHVALALRLFGKQPHCYVATPLLRDHTGLDASQLAAVQLCSDRDLAFIWGPPGTGKTVTLAHVVDEQLAQGRRILLASTTNAAIDQILEKLHAQPWFSAAVLAGTLVRLGRSTADTFGAELGDIAQRVHGAHRAELERRRARIDEVVQQIRYCQALLVELAPAASSQQSFFAAPARLRAAALSRVFSRGLAEAIADASPATQLRTIQRRIVRLERVRVLARARVAVLVAADRDLERQLVDRARVVLCTLTNAHLAPLMIDQRFEVLIAEEAGMATLPSLFYAACLCERAIIVGDPRQLPPIVQSSDDLVRRAIGRNIFEVTVPDPLHSEVVAMLERQYRMHPAIGALVGGMFYAGRLIHAADRAVVDAIAARAPFPGAAVTVMDTGGLTMCERSAKGSSRINRASAVIAADLALEATRAGTTSIGVITPYAAQAGEIRRQLAARGLAEIVDCNTIHRFQGRECDAIILDLVDAPPMRPSALVTDAPNLLNVSISRARGKLVIIADVAYFAAAAPDGLVTTLLRNAIAPATD